MLHKNTGLFRFSHFCAPQINAAVSCDLTRRGGEALYIGNRVRYNQSNIGVGAQTCRLPSISALGHRQVGYLAFGSRRVGSPANCRWGADRSAVWRSGADLSAPQQIVVREPTGRFPRTLSLGARHVGSLDTAYTFTPYMRGTHGVNV